MSEMIVREFPTWEAFIDATNAPTDCARRSSRENSATFKHCTNEQAVEYAKYGWLEGAQRARVASQMMFDRLGALIERVDIQYDVEGHAIDISRYVDGEPECWMRFEQTMIDGTSPRHIRVMLNLAASSGVSVEALLARGSVVCALIELLEYAGHRVELSACEKSSHDGQIYLTRILVKPFEQPLDMTKVAYVFGHPSVLRYHHFALMEVEPREIREAIGVTDGTYGRPAEFTSDEIGKDTIYIGCARYGDSQWLNAQSAERWVRAQLKAQSIELLDEKGAAA